MSDNSVQQRFNELKDSAPPVVNDKFTYDFNELWESADEEQRFIIPELLPSCAVAVLIGEDGIGKTQLVIQLCLTIALRLPTFMSLPVDTDSDRCLVVATEDSRQKFIKASKKQALAMQPDVDPKKVNIKFTEGADFDDYEELILEVEKHLKEHHYALVVVDAMSDLFTLIDGEINSNTHARKIIAALQALCAKYATTVLLIHHAAKTKIVNKLKDGKLFVEKGDAQGAGAITQKPRTVLALTHDARTITNNGRSYRNFLHAVKANLMSKFYVSNVLELSFDSDTLLHYFVGITDKDSYEKNGPSDQPGIVDRDSDALATSGGVLQSRHIHEQRVTAAFQGKGTLTRVELIARLKTVYQVGANSVERKDGLLKELLDAGIVAKEGKGFRHVSATIVQPMSQVLPQDVNWENPDELLLPKVASTAGADDTPPF